MYKKKKCTVICNKIYLCDILSIGRYYIKFISYGSTQLNLICFTRSDIFFHDLNFK